MSSKLTVTGVTLVVIFVISITLVASKPASYHRTKRHAGDQRIAELQALIAMLSANHKQEFGHGHVDPFTAGRRRRRSVDFITYWNSRHQLSLDRHQAATDIRAINRSRSKQQ